MLSGFLFGLVVHWRIYPVIYSLPILRYLATKSELSKRRYVFSHKGTKPDDAPRASHTAAYSTTHQTIQRAWHSLFSVDGLRFGLSALVMFVALGALFYAIYGWSFLYEAYLYHFSRIDPRHNFSPYFYPAYLTHGTHRRGNVPSSTDISSHIEEGDVHGSVAINDNLQKHIAYFLANIGGLGAGDASR